MKPIDTKETEIVHRFLLVFDKRDQQYQSMETAWTDEELKFRWDVISEHHTKEQAIQACEAKKISIPQQNRP